MKREHTFENMNETGLLGLDAISLVAMILKSGMMQERKDPVPQHDSICTGQIYLKELLDTRKFSPYFDNCVGALDGTHIHAVVPPDERRPFRNRKHTISQNVLAVANFDLTFSYVLAGWEGSAHDSRVLGDAKLKGLPLLPGKFFNINHIIIIVVQLVRPNEVM